MSVAQQGIHFKGEGGKRGKPATKPNTEHQGCFIGEPGAPEGKSHDEAYEQTSQDIHQEGSQIKLVFTGIPLGADQVPQDAAHTPSKKYQKYLFHGVTTDQVVGQDVRIGRLPLVNL